MLNALLLTNPINSRLVGKQELINGSCPRMAVRKPSVHFSPAIPPRNNQSFDWFVIGEKKKT